MDYEQQERERFERQIAEDRKKERERQRNTPEALARRKVEALEKIARSLDNLEYIAGLFNCIEDDYCFRVKVENKEVK